MKKTTFLMAAVSLALATVVSGYGQQNAVGENGLAVGVREHQDSTRVTSLPFQDGDMSYMIAYEYHEPVAFWQIGLDVAPSLKSSSNSVDYVATPQINLLINDQQYKIFRGGVGFLRSYSAGAEGSENKWSDYYWQAILGAAIPVAGKLTLSAYGYWPFRKLNDVTDFKTQDLEWGAFLGLTF